MQHLYVTIDSQILKGNEGILKDWKIVVKPVYRRIEYYKKKTEEARKEFWS